MFFLLFSHHVWLRLISDIFRETEQPIKYTSTQLALGKEKETLETAVATLLLVVASVVLACSVVTYAVVNVEQAINTQNNPQINYLKNLENSIMNQTNVMNGTLPQMPAPPPP